MGMASATISNTDRQFNPSLEVACDYPDVEKLVQQLYLAGSPQNVSRLENVLQRMQRSPQGWQLAEALLQSGDSQVRFFGALTFMIKIKLDWETLGSEDAALLLDRLLLWVVRLVNAAEGALVLRKMCASLVTYFLRPSVSWQHCIRHLLCCFRAGSAVAQQSLSENPPTDELVRQLSQLQLLTGLWFCVGLVEEVGKTDDASIETHHYRERVVADISDVVLLLRYAMNIESTQNIRISEEGIKCYQSWVMYAHRAWIGNAMNLDPLRVLTPFALQSLTITDLFDASAEFFTDVLTNFPAFFTADDFVSLAVILSSQSAQAKIITLKSGRFDPEPMAFARLLFAYGDATVQELAKNISDPNSAQILNQLVELLGCDGYAGAEDQACSPCLEFWTTFTEYLIDALFSPDGTPPWLESARQHISRVIEACWKKISTPPLDVAQTWDSEDRSSFNAFRADVEDLLQSSFTLMGIGIFERFADLALESLNDYAWTQLEATLFCLNALSDVIAEEEFSDQILSRLFGSSLFTDILGPHSNVHPFKTRQTAVNLVISYTPFFERHTEYLPPMLNFLFESLKAYPLAAITAKAILSTCWACRKALLPELNAFLRQYEILLTWPNVESTTKAKVMGAIAGIIQALPSDEEKVDPLNVLLRFVESDVQLFMNSLKAGQYEEAQAHGLCALRCLTYMGKAFQAPDDVTIDLDAEILNRTIWSQESIHPSQARIIELMSTVTSSMRSDSDIMEAGCQILRTGYKESVPGPFVFPVFVTEQFVIATDLQTAQLAYVLDTAGTSLSQHSSAPELVHNAAVTYLVHSMRLIRSLGGNPAADPEVASGCINLAGKLIPRFLHTFFNPQVQPDIPNLFIFSLRCLTTAEIMPKRAAATFWATLFQTRGQPSEIQAFFDKLMQEYGPQLSHAVIMGVGGQALRSDLDTLAEPLKALVTCQPKAKTWLTDALSSETFPSKNIGPTEKRIWLQKILNLRGAKGTNQAIREFWMLCRGTNLSFVS